MMDHLNSLYIDDEMNLDEKVRFVRNIRESPAFYRQALELLEQEQVLRRALAPPVPVAPNRMGWFGMLKIWWAVHFRTLASAAAGLAAGILILAFSPAPASPPQNSRFVIFLPQARQVELSGTFTEWRRLPMRPVGRTGYWELSMPVPSGEHRYAFILDDGRRIADPTQPVREWDDFGGENSILRIGGQV